MRQPDLPIKQQASVRTFSRPRLYWTFADAFLLVRRQILQIPRNPDEVFFSILQPIILVLLFRYVFQGAIVINGSSYVDYLMAGIFVQTVIFGATTTGIGLATDMQRGLIDRFRSLPMSQSSILTARTVYDLLRNVMVVCIMWGVGLLVDFHPRGNAGSWLLAVALLLLTSYAFSWVSAAIGLAVKSVEAAQSAGFVWLIPLTFASSAFVQTNNMPDWLRAFADNQPVTIIVNAVRGLLLNTPNTTTIVQATAWCLGILCVAIPLSIAAYRHRTTGRMIQ